VRQKGISRFFLIIIVVIIGMGVVALLVLNQQTKKTIQKDNSNPPNLLTQDNEFINTKYNYSITYSDIFEITTPNPETASSVNFRKKDDNIPAESGISLKVIESSASLKDVCGTPFLENQGILCDKSTFKYTPLLDSLPWEVYEKNVIGIVPTGYIYASMFRDNKIYLIVNYGYQSIEADVFMSNLRLTK